jgi:hypothetical protein
VYHYQAYGLNICSALPLPEFIAVSETAADVVIRFDSVNAMPPETAWMKGSFDIGAEEAWLRWGQIGTFLVQHGKEIIIDRFPGVEERLIRLPLLGIVMSVLLCQRGYLLLHASAMSLHGTAVAFLGHKGSGKSTIAAALYAQGHQLVADDVVAVDLNGAKRPMIFPTFPQFKLWPEAAVACLGDAPDALPRVHPQVEKRARPVTGRFVPSPVALGHLYVLDRGTTLEIEPLRPQEAMIKLITYSYMARFGQQGLQIRGAQHFLQCTELARNIPAYRLKRPSSLALLSTTARLVDTHLTGAASASPDELPRLD